MAARVITIDSSQVSNIQGLVVGQPISMVLNGVVADRKENEATIMITSVLGKPSTQKDLLNDIADSNRKILNEVRQLPKVQPLGET